MIAANTLSALFLLGAVSARTIEYDIVAGDFSKYKGGLYQSVFANDTNKLYVTSSVGRPPVNQSDLLEVDPDTLKVNKDVVPALANNKTGLYAVYGVALDSKTGRIWTTQTRQESVSYYNDEDLTLGAQFGNGIVEGQPRDIWADKDTGLAYVGSSRGSIIEVISTDSRNKSKTTLNISEISKTNFTGVMSFAIDEAARTLWTVSLSNNLAAAINLTDYSAKTYDLGANLQRPSGVAWDTKRKVLYVANQGSNNTVVLNPSTGKVVKTIASPGGPLNAKYDPVYDVVYVACRTGHKVSVIDAEDYSIITELNVTTPNHISLGKDGAIFVTDKSPESKLYKFTPKGKAAAGNSSSNSTKGGRGSNSTSSSTGHAANGAASLAVPAVAGAVAAVAAMLI